MEIVQILTDGVLNDRHLINDLRANNVLPQFPDCEAHFVSMDDQYTIAAIFDNYGYELLTDPRGFLYARRKDAN